MCTVSLNSLPQGTFSTSGSWSFAGYNASSSSGPWGNSIGVPPIAGSILALTTAGQFIGMYASNKSVSFGSTSPGFYGFTYTVPDTSGGLCGITEQVVSVVEIKKDCYSNENITLCINDPGPYNVETLLRDSFSGTCLDYFTNGTFEDVNSFGAGFNSTTGELIPSSAPGPGSYRFRYYPYNDPTYASPGFDTLACTDCRYTLNVSIDNFFTAGTSTATYASPLVYDKLIGSLPILLQSYLTGEDSNPSMSPVWTYEGADPTLIDTVTLVPGGTVTNVVADQVLATQNSLSVNLWDTAIGKYGFTYTIGTAPCTDTETVWIDVQCNASSVTYAGTSLYPMGSPYVMVKGVTDTVTGNTLRGAVTATGYSMWKFGSDTNGGDPDLVDLHIGFSDFTYIGVEGNLVASINPVFDFTDVPAGLYEFKWTVGTAPNCYHEESCWIEIQDAPPICCDHYMDIGPDYVNPPYVDIDEITLLSAVFDGIEYVGSPTSLGAGNVILLGAVNYVTNLVDLLSTLGIPNVTFDYSETTDCIGKANYLRICRDTDIDFTIVLDFGINTLTITKDSSINSLLPQPYIYGCTYPSTVTAICY